MSYVLRLGTPPAIATQAASLALACIHGIGDLHPIVGNPELWRCQGDWDYKKVDEVLVPTPSAWVEQPYGPVWDPEIGDGFEVVGRAPNREDRGYRNRDTRDYIRFHASGHTEIISRSQHKKNKVYDPFKPSASGVGYLGDFHLNLRDPDVAPMYKTWTAMISRCYDTTVPEYPDYGGKGVRVCRRWHSFAAFFRDHRTLSSHYYKRTRPQDVYSLDKDTFGLRLYSPETAHWIPRSVNTAYIHTKAFDATAPDGTVYKHCSTEEFARQFDLAQTQISYCVRGRTASTRGWKFQHVNKNYRYVAPINPLNECVRAAIEGRVYAFTVGDWPPDTGVGSGIRILTQPDAANQLNMRVVIPWDVDYISTENVYGIILTMIARTAGMLPGKLLLTTASQVNRTATLASIDPSVLHMNDLNAEHIT